MRFYDSSGNTRYARDLTYIAVNQITPTIPRVATNLENAGNLKTFTISGKTQRNLKFVGKNLENSGKMENM